MNGDQHGVNAPCTWIQYWVQLESADQAAAYRDYLVNYSLEQRKAGRFARPPNVRLRDVMQWLDFRGVVPSAGAGFVVVLCGDMQRMPGLGRTPAYMKVDIDEDGRTIGLF